MSYKLTVDKILLNYFAEKPNRMEIAFSEIGELANRIVRKCENSILAYTTRDDIEYAVSYRNEIFELDGASVILKNSNTSLLKNIDMLNQTIPEYVRKNCIEVCSDYVKSINNKQIHKKQVHIKPALYALYYESLKEIAFNYGYNLVLHGSLNRDLDLIAIPWIDEIKSHDDMIKEMCDYLGGEILVNNDNLLYSKKPHGRICYIINIFRGGYDTVT